MADFVPHPLACLTLSLTEKCVVLNGGMTDELERIQKEAVLA